MSTREIFDTITRYGINPGQIKIAALERSLERLCGEYTKTRHQRKQFTSPKCTVYKGRAKQNVHNKWIMPPISDSVKSLFFKRFSQ